MKKTRLARLLRFLRDQHGNVLVEVTVLFPILFILLLGSVDFLNAYLQWNEAAKAIEVGARIAAVSDPVDTGLTGSNNIAVSWLSATCTQNTFSSTCMPPFTDVCDGSTQTCTCTGTCTGLGHYSAAAMNLIVYGRDGQNVCGDAGSYYVAGICDMFNTVPSIGPANVKVTYSQSGLGYPGRPSGAVSTISVQLQNVPFHFFFLNGFLGFANNTKIMNNTATTITGEALSSAAAN